MDKKQQHHTVMDYLRWRGDLTFAADPFNEVDNLLLSELAFVDFRGIVPHAIDHHFDIA